jgi:hypothetical protein
MTGLLRRLLSGTQLTIATFGTEGQWGEIDNPQDVALYEKLVREGELVLEDAPSGASRAQGDGDRPIPDEKIRPI